ncbi:type II secretion system F family protein [Candidatus Pacearchaeota archaeon]|nr:type II secretion system F family protein [Candidatus Pacearchaeota archaeon]
MDKKLKEKIKLEKRKKKDEKKRDKILKKEIRKKEKHELKKEKIIFRLEKKHEKLEEKLIKVEENVKTKEMKEEISRQGESRKVGMNPNKKRFVIFLALLFLFVIAIGLVIFSQFKVLIGMILLTVLVIVYLLIRKKLNRYNDIKKMELAFPDFVALMAANLRAGLTVDRALLMSSRKEFAPLDKEISSLGKEIITGKEISRALEDMAMARRIESDEIKKTVLLIISGIRSGGNLSVLLEQVSSNMRERVFVKKRAASNVLMYVIFIFFAVSLGAPILFGLSSVLVEVLTNIVSGLPSDQSLSVNLPFSLTEINVSPEFILYFALFFMVSTAFFAALVLGLVSKGKEREGLKFIVPMIVLSIAIFFMARIVILRYFTDFLG